MDVWYNVIITMCWWNFWVASLIIAGKARLWTKKGEFYNIDSRKSFELDFTDFKWRKHSTLRSTRISTRQTTSRPDSVSTSRKTRFFRRRREESFLVPADPKLSFILTKIWTRWEKWPTFTLIDAEQNLYQCWAKLETALISARIFSQFIYTWENSLGKNLRSFKNFHIEPLWDINEPLICWP